MERFRTNIDVSTGIITKIPLTEAEVNDLLNSLSSSAREKRNMLLSECDWTRLDDADTDKSAWAVYRQALRDVPQQPDFPENIVWPTKPE
jgi:hypothetical protein